MATVRPMLEIDSLSVAFGGVQAVDDVSIVVEAGSLTGLIGTNGAGKTTVLDAVTGFVDATGSVRFQGRELLGRPVHDRAPSGLARTWQSAQLFADLSVRENLAVAASSCNRRRNPRDHRPGIGDAVAQVVEDFELAHVLDRFPTQLSHGQRKLVSIAAAVSAGPSLLLLDEPAAGLDSDESQLLGDRLRGLVAKGVTILLIDHDMELVLGICDTLSVMDKGKLIMCGTPQEVRVHPAVIEAYLGAAEDEAVLERGGGR